MTTTTDREREVLSELAALLPAELVGVATLHREVTAAGFVTGHLVTLRDTDGATHDQTVYLESTPTGADRPGVLRFVADDGDVIDAWLYPNDPALPALGAAVFPDAAAIVLDRLGHPITNPVLELVAYRPGKRAVVRASGNRGAVFLKVVRPDAAERIHSIHRAWRSAGVPVPRPLGWAPEGLLVLEDLGGAPAETAVTDPEARQTLVDALAGMTESIGTVPSEVPARRSLLARLDWYCRRLTGLTPEQGDAIAELAREIHARAGSAASDALTTIHGDFHLGQLRVDPQRPGSVVGLLDIDTAGRGDPTDDAGAFAGHALATAALHATRGAAEAASAWAQLADAWIDRWPDAGGYAGRARAVTATHLLAHALTGTAPTRTLLALAVSVLNESHLMSASFPPHPAPPV